jgi:hypothetical protein
MFSQNKSFQFFVGLGVIIAAWKLWSIGWFASVVESDEEGFQSAIGAVVPILIDTVALVGIVAIAFTKLIYSAIEPLITDLRSYLSESVSKVRDRIVDDGENDDSGVIDAAKLEKVLSDMANEIKSLKDSRNAD